MTKINYSKERLRSNLRMGIVFSAIGTMLVLLSLVTGNWIYISVQSVGIGQIGAGIFMFMIYYFESRKQYLTLKNGELIKNTLFPKKIKLNQIKYIREFAADLTLISEKNKLVIDTQIMDLNSLVELKNELKNYNLKNKNGVH